MNEVLTYSEVLRYGFEYEYYPFDVYSKRDKKFTVANNMIFKKNVWEYDVELDGEIEINYTLFKTKRTKWILIKNGKTFKIFSKKQFESIVEMQKNIELNFLYILESPLGTKIGITKNIDDRKRVFGVKLPFKWRFKKIFTVHRNSLQEKEKLLHQKFKNKKINGEWFNINENDIERIYFLLNN